MTLSAPSAGSETTKIAGMMAKYLATSLAIEKVVSAPRVISICLPTSTISMTLVGSLSRSTMLPASRAAWVPVCMATPTSAWASAGASLEPSPHMATSRPLACSSRISRSLSSGVASARKSSTPASEAMAAAVTGLSPVIITVRRPMRRRSAKRSFTPGLDHVLQVDDADQRAVLGHRQRRAAGAGDAVDGGGELGRHAGRRQADGLQDRVDRALAPAVGAGVEAGDAGWWR